MIDEKKDYIKELETLLSQGNVSNNIKKLISNLTTEANNNNNSSNENTNKKEEPQKKEDDFPDKKSTSFENADTLFKIKNIMDIVNQKDDARICLIESLKPFLSASRQKKIPECIKILQLANIGKIFGDNIKNDKQ